MYSQERLHERLDLEGLPLMMAVAVPTHFDVDALVRRADGLIYSPHAQRNLGGETTMGRSTCSRRDSTGIIFTDNDRQQDD